VRDVTRGADCQTEGRRRGELCSPRRTRPFRRGARATKKTRHPLLVCDDELWPDGVDGARLLDEVVNNLVRYVVLPVYAAVAIALWTLHSFAMACWSVSAAACHRVPDEAVREDTLLAAAERHHPAALIVSHLTPAVLFRVTDEFKPTLLSDEADTWLSDERSELRCIFNSGHTIGAANVPRCVGDDYDVKLFSTWAGKAVAMIGRPPSTIEDRSVRDPTRAQDTRREGGPPPPRPDPSRTRTLRQRMRRWTRRHADELRAADPLAPRGLHDRAIDNWRPFSPSRTQPAATGPTKARRRR